MALAPSPHTNLEIPTNPAEQNEGDRTALKIDSRTAAKQLFRLLWLVGLSLTVILIGCTKMEKEKAFSTENFLVQAGFKYRVADTPQRLEQLKKLPQRKLIHRERNGLRTYLYADALECRCLWSGDEAAYQTLQERLRSARLAAQQQKGLWAEDMELLGSSEPAGSELDEMDPAMLPFF